MSKPLITAVPVEELLARAAEFKAQGWRFSQACATRNGESAFDILYTFVDDTANEVSNLRVTVASDQGVPSVGKLFPCAFMFENEMHDLFGINVSGITLDYRGGFYHLHIPAPMAQAPERAAKKAPKAEQEA